MDFPSAALMLDMLRCLRATLSTTHRSCYTSQFICCVLYDGADVNRDQAYLRCLAYPTLTSCGVLDTIIPPLAIPPHIVPRKAIQRKLFLELSRWTKWQCSLRMSRQGSEHGFYGEPVKHGSSQARLAGEVFAGRLRATVAGTAGDYKARHDLNGLSRYYSATLFCESCVARQPTSPANACWTYAVFQTPNSLGMHHHRHRHAHGMVIEHLAAVATSRVDF